MSLEMLNYQLFNYLNAPETASNLDIYIGIFIANDTLYILLLFLAMTWLLGTYQSKALALKAVLTTITALLIGYVISLGYHHPRPFMLDMGNTLITHAPTASFPSNHMLIFSSVALSYVFAKQLKFGLSLFAFALLVAWSRIYVGVHFPLDMLGAICVALMTNIMLQWIWNRYQDPIMSFCLKIYHLTFNALLKRGWIR